MKKPETMYQVQVTTDLKHDVLIGPAVGDRRVLEPMVEAINLSVAKGKEKTWRDARVVTLQNVIH